MAARAEGRRGEGPGACGGRDGCRSEEGFAIKDAHRFACGEHGGVGAGKGQGGVVADATVADDAGDQTDVVGGGVDGGGCGGSNEIDAEGVGGAGSTLIAGGIGDPCGVTQLLVMAEDAAVGVAPGETGAGDEGITEIDGAVIDADGFTGHQDSGEGAADDELSVIGAAGFGDGALEEADIVGDGRDGSGFGWGGEIKGEEIGGACGGEVAGGIGDPGGEGMGTSR